MSERDAHKALYEIWKGMCHRTICKTRKDYPHYGGRGIKVCPEWRGTKEPDQQNYDGFLAFEQWALTHGYRPGMTLDRVNNNAGYSPYNTRWISKKAQAYNRQTNVYYTFKGRTMTAKQWGDQCGLPKYVICKRMKKGWGVERTLTTPLKGSVAPDAGEDSADPLT